MRCLLPQVRGEAVGAGEMGRGRSAGETKRPASRAAGRRRGPCTRPVQVTPGCRDASGLWGPAEQCGRGQRATRLRVTETKNGAAAHGQHSVGTKANASGIHHHRESDEPGEADQMPMWSPTQSGRCRCGGCKIHGGMTVHRMATSSREPRGAPVPSVVQAPRRKEVTDRHSSGPPRCRLAQMGLRLLALLTS